LVVEHEAERIEVAAGVLLDPARDQLEPAPGRVRRRLPGQPLAHLEAERGGERHLGPVAGAGDRIGAHPHLDGPSQVGAYALHRPRPERLDPGLLDRVEHRAGDLVGGRAAGVHRRIVMPELQRRRVGITPRLGDLALGQRPSRHRHFHILARRGRRVGGEAELKLRLARDRPRRAGQHLAEGFEGVVVASQLNPPRPGGDLHHYAFAATLSGRSLPKTRW
jgi:hypothetical protein